MTINTALQAGGQIYDNALNADRTWTNVTAGSLIVVMAARFDSISDAYQAGDLTKNSGTCTLDAAFALDATVEIAFDGGAPTIAVGIWSTTVAAGGGGSLVTRLTTGRNVYTTLSSSEFSASSGWSTTAATRREATSTGSQATNNTSPASSGNAASAAGALFLGACGFDGSGTLTITEDGAFTLIAESQDASAHMTGSHIYRIVTTGTTDAAEWSIGNNNGWVAAVVAYKEITPSGGGGGDTRARLIGSDLFNPGLVGGNTVQ